MASKTFVVRLIIEVDDPMDYPDTDEAELAEQDVSRWNWRELMAPDDVANVTFVSADVEELK